MYGWSGDGFMGRLGWPGNNSCDYGTDYSRDSRDYRHDYGEHFFDFGYDSDSNSYKPPRKRKRRRSHFDVTIRRSHRGYREREQGPPWGRGDPSFRGNFVPTPHNRHPNEQTSVFVDHFLFGGGFRLKVNSLQHIRERNKTSEDQGPPAVKQMNTSAEHSKFEEPRSDGDDNAEEAAQSTMNDEDHEDGTQEETEHTQSSSKEHQESQNEFIGPHFVNSIQFSCTLCHFGTFYEEEMDIHQQSDFHKEHLNYVKNRLPKVKGGFIEANLKYLFKKTKQTRKQLEDLRNTIHRIYWKRDFTRELGIENFVKKMDVSHCEACNIFLPLDHSFLQSHLESSAHKKNLRNMMEISKAHAFRTSLRFLQGKQNLQKLEQYKKGKNPFRIDDDDDEEYITIDYGRDLAPEGEESGEMPCITLSDSEGEEEDDDFQGQNSFINDEEDIRSHCSTELAAEIEESQQMPCSIPPNSERDEKNFQGQNNFINNDEEENARSDYSAESAPEAEKSPQNSFINDEEDEENTRSDYSAESAPEAEESPQNSLINEEENSRSDYSAAEESPQNSFINDDEEENNRSDYSAESAPKAEESPQNSFINDEEENTRSDYSAELVPEESPQMPCSIPPDSEKEEDDPVPEQEGAEDSS
ncbi:DBIRD complex subunit ZNF326-like isoform X2 [Hyla sarda]|uniref:DBIRD complex subunit ZNF326-like isoform X2 n=1 Tax=Hyla sarda TaxID=327740 RepID=UPI0024C3407D|nr:DBIRD complex subunit ZNF326-like isoform X2 [Hyla sarda]